MSNNHPQRVDVFHSGSVHLLQAALAFQESCPLTWPVTPTSTGPIHRPYQGHSLLVSFAVEDSI